MKLKAITNLAIAALFMGLFSVVAVSPALASVDMVVLHVTGAPLKRGSVIDGSVAIKLETGWSVTLVAADGSVVKLVGPSELVPANASRTSASDPKLIEVLKGLLSADERSTASLGVVRSGDGPAQLSSLPEAWVMSVNQSGARCIKPDVAKLWREDSAKAINLVIKQASGVRSANARWPAGSDTLAINSASFRDGSTYVIELGGKRTSVTVHVLPSDLDGLAAQAAWMAQSGCKEQALTLLETVR